MLLKRLLQIRTRAEELEKQLADPEFFKDRARFQASSKELARLRPTVDKFSEYERVSAELVETENFLKGSSKDPDLLKLYEEERAKLSSRRAILEHELEEKLLDQTDTDYAKDIIVEIRAGTGGEEAALFAGDLFRMYSRFAATQGLKLEVFNSNPTGKGGFKEIIFGISGENAYRRFRFESGIHRVQRVPETESSGRIHTSAATVAVLPEANEVEVELKPDDLRIEVCRAGGPGGQGVNTTDSAVQIVHLPTGLTVRCQDERSQLKNKNKALRVLRARLYEAEREKQHRQISDARKKQVGTGDRSEKIRTYNFPDRRVTDHRVGVTLYTLPQIMEGNLDELLAALEKEDRARRLKGEQ